MDKLIKKSQELEALQKLLEHEAFADPKVLPTVIAYKDCFFNELPTMKAYFGNIEDNDSFKNLGFSESPQRHEDIIKIIDKHIVKSGVNTASGNYFGYIPAGGLPTSAVGNYLADLINRHASLSFMAPQAVKMESSVIKWVAGLIGYTDSAFGAITSGGSLATLSAVITARTHKKISSTKDTTVYITQHTHHCLKKALFAAGLVDITVREIPLDKYFRMDVQALRSTIVMDLHQGLTPWMIVATAGSTDTGSIDPLISIHETASSFKLWLHVDAAYGGFFMLTKQGQKLLSGLHHADSVVLDAHKSLFLPYGAAFLLVKDHRHLLKAHQFSASYLQDAEENHEKYAPSNLSLELSRPFRGLGVWYSLQMLGINYFRLALEEKLLLTQYFYQQISQIKHIEVAGKPSLSIVTFRYNNGSNADRFNRLLHRLILKDGRIFISTTILENRIYLRFAILSFRTHIANIDLALLVIKECIHQLEA